MIVNMTEARQIVQGKATALARYFPSVLPIKIGEKIALSYMNNGRRVIFAEVLIKTIQPVTVSSYSGKNGQRRLETEGWSHVTSWRNNLLSKYDKSILNEKNGLYRFSFNVVRIDEPKEDEPKEIDMQNRP